MNLRKLALGQASEVDELLKAHTHSSSNSATFSYVTAEVRQTVPYTISPAQQRGSLLWLSQPLLKAPLGSWMLC